MSDNILSAVLTFSLLAAGTAAIGSEMFNTRQAAPAPREVVTLPTVTIVAHRAAPTDVVTLPAVRVVAHRTAPAQVVSLPMVTVTAHRALPTELAVESVATEPQRVQ